MAEITGNTVGKIRTNRYFNIICVTAERYTLEGTVK